MKFHQASALSLAATAAAVACAAAIASGNAYAETPTIDDTHFVSTRSRADVRAELMSQRESVSAGGGASEWAMQHNDVPQFQSGYTSRQARSDYQAARDEVSAMTAEDSGSSYLARHAARANTGITVAGAAR